MIPRYSRSRMQKHWSEEAKFHSWLLVECSVLEILEKNKILPKGISALISRKARIDVQQIAKIEAKVKHDVIAFSTSIAKQFGTKGRFFHYGLTSSDVVDTSFSLLLRDALLLIKTELENTCTILSKLSKRYQNLPAIGRTHGVHAEPSIFGLKFLSWYCEAKRRLSEIDQAIKTISYGKISGAVGVYGILTPLIEKEALQILHLKAEPVSTQIIPRDRHLTVMTGLMNVGNLIDRIAVEFRHLQRTEVGEIEERFSEGQKGSSAMPHKKNPITAENLSGCARILRGYLFSVTENAALWHERDISHSSVERVCFPDAFILLDYMIDRMNGFLSGITVNEKNVTKNLNHTQGVYFSGAVLNKLVEKGMNREQAYALIQAIALRSLKEETSFQVKLTANKQAMKFLSKSEIDSVFNLKNRLKNTEQIYQRVFR